MPDILPREQIEYIKSFLRRKFQNNLADLKLYAEQIFQTATEEVVLTSTSSEGGHDAGAVKFNKMLVLGAVEEIIADIDPSYLPPTRGRVVIPDYRFCTP